MRRITARWGCDARKRRVTYLADSTDLAAERIRAVSYGQSPERLVDPDAFGSGLTGQANRRVTLVVEHAATPMFTRR